MANTCNAEPLEGRSKTKTLDRFLIICKGHKWMTHKTRLSSEASPTLETWFDLCYDDGPRDFIDLKEDNPDIVDHFVSYLYSGNYDDLSTGLKYTLREPRAGFVRTESVISLSSTDTSDCSGDENLQSDGLSEMDFLMASMAELGSEEANCTPPELDLPLRLTDGGLPALDSGPSSSFLGGVVTPRSSNSPQSTAKEDMVKQNMMENPNEDKAAAKLLINAKVYEFAEKYEIPKLKDLSWEKFELNLALGCRSSKFPNIIRTVYYGSSPPSDRGLRDLIMANSNVYMTSPLNRGEFYQLIKEGGDFALDLFHKFIPVAEQVELNTCQTCKELKSFDHTCSWCSTTIHNCVECNAQTLTRSKCPMCNPFELICPTCNTQSPWRINASKVVPLTCHGHSRPITHLSFSSMHNDGEYYLVSACKDNYPMLRDGITGDWIGTFVGHKGAVWQSRLSSDATLSATASADFTAKVWDTYTGECLHTVQHNHIVRAVAFPNQPSPQILATGGHEKKLRIYDLSRTSASSSPTSPDSKTDGTTFFHHEIGPGVFGGPIKAIVWGTEASNSILITASDDNMVRWWDLRTQAPVAQHPISGTLGTCELNAPSTDARGVLSVASGKTAYFFDGFEPGRLIKAVKLPYEVSTVAYHGEQNKFVTGSSGDTWVRVHDFDTEAELDVHKGHHGPVWSVSFSPDGKIYATGSEDGTIKLWKFCKDSYGLWK